jgi:hypothetical protein
MDNVMVELSENEKLTAKPSPETSTKSSLDKTTVQTPEIGNPTVAQVPERSTTMRITAHESSTKPSVGKPKKNRKNKRKQMTPIKHGMSISMVVCPKDGYFIQHTNYYKCKPGKKGHQKVVQMVCPRKYMFDKKCQCCRR